MCRIKLIAMLALAAAVWPVAARAAEHEGGEKKTAGHEASGEKKSESESESESEGAAAAEALGPSGHYVHKWIRFPEFAGSGLPGAGGTQAVAPRAGRATIVIFIASWCEPCQQLVPALRNLEKRYQRLNADFHFVFSHDTVDDASGFMKEFGIDGAVLANHEILKTFHNPDLPSIYVGDRSGWLATRFIKADQEGVQKLDEFLKYLTAY